MDVTVLTVDQLSGDDLANWRRFQREDPQLRNPFLSPEFTLAVARAKRGVEVARLEQAGETIGFLPFERARGGLGRPIGAGLSDCQGVVHAVGSQWGVRDLLRGCRLVAIDFDHLVSGGGGVGTRTMRLEPSPIVDLRDGYDSYASRQLAASRSFRRLSRRWEALRADFGDVRFEFRTTNATVLSAMFAWKSAQYRRTLRSDRFGKPWIRHLVGALMNSETDHFRGVLGALWVGGQLAAVQAALASDHVLALWFPAFGPEFARYSPGNVLRLCMFEAAAHRGIEYVELGKGFSVHKEQLKTGDLQVAEARLERRSIRAAAYRAYREPPRRLERFVLDRPRLRMAIRHARTEIGRARSTATGH